MSWQQNEGEGSQKDSQPSGRAVMGPTNQWKFQRPEFASLSFQYVNFSPAGWERASTLVGPGTSLVSLDTLYPAVSRRGTRRHSIYNQDASYRKGMVSDHSAAPCEPRMPQGLEDSVPLLLVATSAPHQASCHLVAPVWLISSVATAVSQMLAGYVSHVPGSQRGGRCVNISWEAVGKGPQRHNHSTSV